MGMCAEILAIGKYSAAIVDALEYPNVRYQNAKSKAPAIVVLFGILEGEKPSSFVIVKIESFENTYSRMLYWESDMPSDIGPIFPSAERLANVTSLEFQDVISKNKDVRVLYDAENKEVLLYSFLNNDILIITDNLNTLHTIIARITAESLVR